MSSFGIDKGSEKPIPQKKSSQSSSSGSEKGARSGSATAKKAASVADPQAVADDTADRTTMSPRDHTRPSSAASGKPTSAGAKKKASSFEGRQHSGDVRNSRNEPLPPLTPVTIGMSKKKVSASAEMKAESYPAPKKAAAGTGTKDEEVETYPGPKKALVGKEKSGLRRAKSARALVMRGWPFANKSTSRSEKDHEDLAMSKATQTSESYIGKGATDSEVSTAVQTDIPLLPTIQVDIPAFGKEMPQYWAGQMKEQMKDFREMLTEAFRAAIAFRDWEEKSAKSLYHLPAPEDELDYDEPNRFAEDVYQQLRRRRIVHDYEVWIQLKMRDPDRWDDWWPFKEQPRRGNRHLVAKTLRRLAHDDALCAGPIPLGKVRYQDWDALLNEYIKHEIGKLSDLEKIQILVQEGNSEVNAEMAFYDILTKQEGRSSAEARNRLIKVWVSAGISKELAKRKLLKILPPEERAGVEDLINAHLMATMFGAELP